MTTPSSSSGPRGVYGLALVGLDLPRWTAPADGWVEAAFAVEHVVEPSRRRGLHRHRGSFPLGTGGRVALDRSPLAMTFRTPVPLDADDLVHPHLSIAAAALSYWLGRDPFHAGAVVGADGAWMVAGRSGAGKSTTVAALAAAGVPVLSDDLVVVEGGEVFCGPRAVDLRLDAAGVLGAAHHGLLDVRDRTRRRLPLPPAPRQVPLAGWIDLEWGPEVALVPLDAPERFRRLVRRRTFPAKLPAGDAVLDLAERPAWALRRPRDFAALPAVVDEVVRLTGAARVATSA